MFDKNKPQSINTTHEQQSTDDHRRGRAGAQPRRPSLDTGISPTYYQDGDIVSTTAQQSSFGSPVYDDSSRVFFSHHEACICKGSGVGCECTRDCNC